MRLLRRSANKRPAPAREAQPPDPSRRLALMLAGSVLGAGGLGWRLYDWHVNQSADLAARGSTALLSRSEINPRRGSILDTNGDVLAISRGARRVIANPQEIHAQIDPFVLATRLGALLGIEPVAIADRIGDPTHRYAEIVRGVYGQQAAELEQAVAEGELPGIRLDSDRIRLYPNQELAAHLVGFVGESPDQPGDVIGQAGIEGWYDDVLGGRPGQVSFDLDRLGRRIPTGRYAVVPPEHGADVVLTIDRTIQYIAEQELDSAIDRFGAAAGTIVVTDPRSGGLLALAVRPTYIPGRVHQYQTLGPK